MEKTLKELKSLEIKNAIKNLLKKSNLTYDEVATYLNCSLPTVNRILGPEEIGLNRILELCELLNITFTELGELTKDPQPVEEKFTLPQEHFLSKNNHYFAYYLKLMAGDSPEKIAKSFNLNQQSTDKYLIKLEKYDLIKIINKNKVRTTYKNLPRMGSGPLGNIYHDKILNGTSQFFIKKIKSNLDIPSSSNRVNVTFSVSTSKMTELTYRKFSNEVENLYKRYNEISDMEEKIKNSKDLKTVVCNYGHTIVENDDLTLKLLDNIFGEIKNI